MGFIEKSDPVVLNIKLTSKGRELLSKGNLNFSSYAIGDSEMDYGFLKNAREVDPNYDPFNNNILKPVDKNPNILSFITRNVSGDTHNVISSVPSTQTIIQNDISSVGFFTLTTGGTASFNTDTDYVKQPDAMIIISGVTGGTQLKINKAPTYQANVNEPEVGDLILIRWTNPSGDDTTGYTINKDFPSPNLFYRINEIVSGSLSSDNLVVEVDRPLPDFNGSGSTVAGALVYYNFVNFTGETTYSTDYADEALLAFLQNCQCPTIRFPFWNMSIIFTEEIVGVQPNDRKFYDFNTRNYAGFVSYIQQQSPTYKKLGVIHYTNSSPANTYAEEFFYDIDDPDKRPKLEIPLVMWHKSSGATLGLTLKASGNKKILTREGSPQVDQEPTSLNTTYYDLTDPQGNVVGKVFMDLKIFVIEDQELLFAMSYKSNRSWTLPNYGVDINANVTFGCPDCVLTYQVSGITPTTVGGDDGQLHIYNVDNFIGDPSKGQLLLEVQASGVSGTTQIFFNKITGDTYVTGLTAGTYVTYISDLGSTNCTVSGETVINSPSAPFGVYDFELTQSLLDPDFKIEQATSTSPTSIIIKNSNIGAFIGTAYTAVVLTGTTPTLGDWIEIGSLPSDQTTISSLTFQKVYTVFVRDVTGSTVNDYIGSGTSTVWKDYVAVLSSINPNYTITQASDTGGTYLQVSNYIKSGFTPYGIVEFSIYKTNEVPLIWQTSPKLYYTDNVQYNIGVRERVGTAIVDKRIKAFDAS